MSADNKKTAKILPVTKQYRALTGLNYPDPKKPGYEKRVEKDEVVTDIPPTSLGWLLQFKLVEEVAS